MLKTSQTNCCIFYQVAVAWSQYLAVNPSIHDLPRQLCFISSSKVQKKRLFPSPVPTLSHSTSLMSVLDWCPPAFLPLPSHIFLPFVHAQSRWLYTCFSLPHSYSYSRSPMLSLMLLPLLSILVYSVLQPKTVLWKISIDVRLWRRKKTNSSTIS